jgi:hypothetical protein
VPEHLTAREHKLDRPREQFRGLAISGHERLATASKAPCTQSALYPWEQPTNQEDPKTELSSQNGLRKSPRGIMKKLASIFVLMSLALAATTATSEAGWNKRGWYQKRPGANCVMRKVVVAGVNGKVVVRKVRVCR